MHLGTPEHVYYTKPHLLWMLRITGILCLGPAAMCFVAVFVPFGTNPPSPGVALLAGCLIAIAGFAFLLSGFLIRQSVWIIFPSAVVELKGSKAHIFPWAIAELRQEVLPRMGTAPGPPPIRYALTSSDGRSRTIDFNVRDRNRLVGQIAKRLQH